eukprot:6190014-Pleurochrysis_carterae.AAC.2
MSAWISRPAYDGLYCEALCVWRVALASVQPAQPSKRPWASEPGASAVIDGRARRRVEPACRRACMHGVASEGDMTLTW